MKKITPRKFNKWQPCQCPLHTYHPNFRLPPDLIPSSPFFPLLVLPPLMWSDTIVVTSLLTSTILIKIGKLLRKKILKENNVSLPSSYHPTPAQHRTIVLNHPPAFFPRRLQLLDLGTVGMSSAFSFPFPFLSFPFFSFPFLSFPLLSFPPLPSPPPLLSLFLLSAL